MKKILTRIFDKKRFVFAFGLLIGVALMNGVSRGLDEYTSAGVSYTGKDGKTTTVKAALDDVINKSLVQIDDLKKQVSDLEKKVPYDLSEKAQVGDYVAYNAGTWSSSADIPAQVGFGGYKSGQSKNSSVEWCSSENLKTTLKGWRVLKKQSGKVYLVHAGQPECYYHGPKASDSIANLDARAKDQYLNSTYAEHAYAMTKAEFDAITPASNSLRTTGSEYWFATTYTGTDLGNGDSCLLYATSKGGSSYCYSYHPLGFRPVIVLKSGIQTTGKVHDEFGQDAWNLILPPQ